MNSASEKNVVAPLKRVPERKPAGGESALRGRAAAEAGHARHGLHRAGKLPWHTRVGGIAHLEVQDFGHSACNTHRAAEAEPRRIQQSRAEFLLLMERYHLPPRHDVGK